MPPMLQPALVPYGAAILLLAFNLMVLWLLSGVLRSKYRSAASPEDSAMMGAPYRETEAPEIARVLRAHTNAQATFVVFAAIGSIYVWVGGPAPFAWATFGVLVLSRWAHSAFYLAAKQPWRTASFLVTILSIVALMVETSRRLLVG